MTTTNLLPISKSRIALIRTCPLLAWAHYKMQTPTPDTYTGKRGRDLHEAWAAAHIYGPEILNDLPRETRQIIKDAMANDPLQDYPEPHTTDTETHRTATWEDICETQILSNTNDNLETNSTIITGITDLTRFWTDRAITQDIKFSTILGNHDTEALIYGLLTSAAINPMTNLRLPLNKITVQFYYPLTNQAIDYRFSGQEFNHMYRHPVYSTELVIPIPNELPTVIKMDELLTEILTTATNVNPTPTPGPHCHDHYGSPCPLLTSGMCNAAQTAVVNLPAALTEPQDASVAMELAITAAWLREPIDGPRPTDTRLIAHYNTAELFQAVAKQIITRLKPILAEAPAKANGSQLALEPQVSRNYKPSELIPLWLDSLDPADVWRIVDDLCSITGTSLDKAIKKHSLPATNLPQPKLKTAHYLRRRNA